MRYRSLGRSGIDVSLLSLGTGGASHFGQNTGVDDAGRSRLVRCALDSGINLFDTAEGYKRSEELLGNALSGVARDSYLLATKWSYRPAGEAPKPGDLTASLERSLKRLQTDVIDIMQFHGILPGDYEMVTERFLPELISLRDAGKVRLIGFTQMMTIDPRAEVAAQGLREHGETWDVIMLKYGIMNQWPAKEVFPLAEQLGVGVMNMAPIRQTLTREADRQAVFDSWRKDGSVNVDALDADDPFGWLLHDGVESVIDAGYRFGGMHPAVSTVITGTATVEHLEANVRSIEADPLPAADHERLVEVFGNSAAPN